MTGGAMLQLTGARTIPWTTNVPEGLSANEVVFGRDDTGAVGEVQVAVATAATRPTKALMDAAWKSRGANTAMPVVVVAIHGGSAWVYVGSGDILGPAPVGSVARQLQSVLDEPNVMAAQVRLTAVQRALSSGEATGFSNHFLFASYHLRVNVPRRPDWSAAQAAAETMLAKQGKELVAALGFSAESVSNVSGSALVLRAASGSRRAIAVLLDESEHFDHKSAAYQLSPVAHGLELATREEVPWLVVLRQSTLRLYPGRDGVGVGQRGQSETYFELDLGLLDTDLAALLPLIFSAGALEKGGTAEQILEGSSRYAAELGANLRDRVYEGVVPTLSIAIAQRLPKLGLSIDAEGLKVAYALTLRILFRILFQAYGEDSELLPAGRNSNYDANSLQKFVKENLTTDAAAFGASSSVWLDLTQVWDAIFNGNQLWEVPAYGGSLFDPAAAEGELLQRLVLPDSVLGPALQAMLTEVTEDGTRGPVDFRSLQVREFGTIYEGLLESSLSLAEVDLTVDPKGAFVPAKPGDEVAASAGTPYFHSASGERKATGSYFTPKIVVDHLIERSVEPALDAHLQKVKLLVDEGKEREAANLFWDFRVADLAMGSAHFLVAAVDKIERGLRDFLTVTEMPRVRAELSRLAGKAREALGDDIEAADAITEAQLLRRQVARRCIYGLDINPLAVELSRLALWIHTFVPGLPMSSLDHGLVYGNSLTGIGTIGEALDALGAGGLLEPLIREPLDIARTALTNFANASEADKSEVERGSQLLRQARDDAAPAKAILDVAIATRLGVVAPASSFDQAHFDTLATRSEVREAVDGLSPAHLPLLFPEVFNRERPGFDVLVGNPPWEKVRHEPQQFWVVRDPGLHSLSANARAERIEVLRASRPLDRAEELNGIARSTQLTAYLSRAFHLQASQHYDFAKLFAERNLTLVRDGGFLGLVLPQALLVLGGWAPIRRAMVETRRLEVLPIRNAGGWAFENVHAQTTIAVLAVSPGSGVSISAAASSAVEFRARSEQPPMDMSLGQLKTLSDDLNVPWFESPESPAVFSTMAGYPRLGGGESWISGKADSTRWDFSASGKHSKSAVASPPSSGRPWRVTMTRHVSAFSITPSAEGKWISDPATLVGPGTGLEQTAAGVVVGAEHPPIVYRFPTNNDNSRTLIAAPLPSRGWLYSKGYAHGVRVSASTSTIDVLALLGYLNSVPADWWARRFVDRHLGKRIIEGMPMPRWDFSTRDRVASLVAGIVLRSGVSEIAGSRSITAIAANDEPDATAEISALALVGLGLGVVEAETIFEDFSDTPAALPAKERNSILAHLRGAR